MINPILKIEYLKEGRNIRFPLTILFYDAILAFVMILFMLFNAESFHEGYYYDTSTYIYQFLIISSIQILAVFVMMPFSVSELFTVDREKHLLEQFTMIPGVSKQFVEAKIFMVLSMNGLVFLSGLPIVSLSCIYTGAGWLKMVRLGFMILLFSFWSGAITIFFYSICTKVIWAFAGSIFAHLMFAFGTIVITEIIRNAALMTSNTGEIPVSVSYFCLFLMVLNPLSSYMGYYGNLTGNAGLVTTFCSHIGIDATGKMFGLLYYKISTLMCIAVGALFLVLSIWRMEKNWRK